MCGTLDLQIIVVTLQKNNFQGQSLRHVSLKIKTWRIFLVNNLLYMHKYGCPRGIKATFNLGKATTYLLTYTLITYVTY